jgi:pimeloyl-ACP methyl ester carboxylesterase
LKEFKIHHPWFEHKTEGLNCSKMFESDKNCFFQKDFIMIRHLLLGASLTVLLLASNGAFASKTREFQMPNTNFVIKQNDPSRTLNGSFVQLSTGHVVYARHVPAQGEKPTIALMNGLDDAAMDWEPIIELLTADGYGVLNFDFRGQGWSLAYDPFNLKDLEWQDQVKDVEALRMFFGLKKIVVSGLSYGGGIAIAYATVHPENVEKIIAFDPFIAPIEPQEQQIQSMVDSFIMLNPFADRKMVYESIFTTIVFSTYHLSEPKILDQPNKQEAVVKLALGMRSFNIFDRYSTLRNNTVVLVGGSEDNLVTQAVLTKAWTSITKSMRSAYVVMLGLPHRTTTYDPVGSVNIIKEALRSDGVLNNGRMFTLNSFTNKLSEDKNLIQTSFAPASRMTCKQLF